MANQQNRLNRTRQLPRTLSKENSSTMKRVRKNQGKILSSLLFCLVTLLGNIQYTNAYELGTEEELTSNSNYNNMTDVYNYFEPIEPTECVEYGKDLLQAVGNYYQGGTRNEYDSYAAQNLGWPIESWCISDYFYEGLNDGPLGENVSNLLHQIRSNHNDDDAIASLEVEDLIEEWIASMDDGSCSEVCDYGTSTSTSHPSGSSTLPISGGSPTLTPEITTENSFDYYYGDTKEPQDLRGPSSNNQEEKSINMEYNSEEQQVQYNVDEWNAANEEPDTIYKESHNQSTTGMLFRLIPVKLVAVLSLMCLVLGLRQFFLNSDGDSCCSKIGSKLGFGSEIAYQGIDPSDSHQKSVDFEMLQLAASGDGDLSLDEDIEIS